MTEPVSFKLIKGIEKKLNDDHPKLISVAYRGDEEAREVLKDIVKTEYHDAIDTDYKAEFVMQEIIGLGIIERIPEDRPDVTDVGFDGRVMFTKNHDGEIIDIDESYIDESYVDNLIQRMAVRLKKEFTKKTRKLDGVIGNLRIQARHKSISPEGTTFSIRIHKSTLVLTIDNFKDFADEYMLFFYRQIIKAHCSMMISGGMGFGKTTFQKLLLSLCEKGEKPILIADEAEFNSKNLYPHLHTYMWTTSADESFEESIIDAKRNDASWVMPLEVRGKEVGALLDCLLAGLSVMSTIHCYSVRAIPRRLVTLLTKYFPVNEQATLNDIYSYLKFGVQLKVGWKDGKMFSYLGEMAEYRPNGTENIIYKRQWNGERFITKKGKLSYEILEKLWDGGVAKENIKELEEVFGFEKKSMDS